MKFPFWLFISIQILLMSCNRSPSHTGEAPGIIPKPVLSEHMKGQFVLSGAARISVSGDPEELDMISSYFITEIERLTGFHLQLTRHNAGAGSIQFILKDTGESPEGYRLTILPDQLKIEAGDAAGLYPVSELKMSLSLNGGECTLMSQGISGTKSSLRNT